MTDRGMWSILGIAPTEDLGAIKQAYAARLKVTRPDELPEAYQVLRRAYEAALSGESSFAASFAAAPAARGDLPKLFSGSPTGGSHKAPLTTFPSEAVLNLQPLLDACRDSTPEQARRHLDTFEREQTGERLDGRLALQSALLTRFGDFKDHEFGLLFAAIDKFGWDNHLTSPRRAMMELVQPLVRRARARRTIISALSESSRRWNVERHIVQALRGPPRPLWFQWLAISPRHFHTAARLLDGWHARLPSIFDYELNPDSVHWWEIRLWESGLTFHRTMMIMLLSAFMSLIALTGLMMLLNSGEPWALSAALAAGPIIAVSGVIAIRRLIYRIRRRLHGGAWPEIRGWLKRIAKDIGLVHWLSGTCVALSLASTFLISDTSKWIFGGALLVLLCIRFGVKQALLSALLAIPTGLALHAWATFHSFAWQNRYMTMGLIGWAGCFGLLSAGSELARWRGWSFGLRRAFLVGIGVALIYAPLFVWKDLAHG